MAKDDKAEVEMTVVHIRTTSDNATLQENVRNVANMLARALARPTPQPRLSNPATPAQITSGNGAEPSVMDDYDDVIDAELANDAPKPKAAKRGKSKTVKVLNDVDLESGDVPLTTFYEQKQPSGTSKLYLMIAAWFKEHRGLDEITAEHIYTCYRWLKMNPPKDITQPLRDMKTQGWFDSGTTRGSYAINQIGMNEARDMNNSE
jgi:hypothetical protein